MARKRFRIFIFSNQQKVEPIEGMILNSRTKFQDYNILGDKTNFQKYSNPDRICELSYHYTIS